MALGNTGATRSLHGIGLDEKRARSPRAPRRFGEVERQLAAQVHRRQGDGRYGEFRGWVELTRD